MSASNPLPPFDPAKARAEVLGAIARAAKACGRAADVTLVAVSKQQPWERIAPILGAGQVVFGENRVQEATERWMGRRKGLELRLIGPLQTNKVKDALSIFDVIETVDREGLAAVLSREISNHSGPPPRLYVQVNTGEEPQKAGVFPQAADHFIDLCDRQYGLKIEGLMCIPPQVEPSGPHFALLAAIAARNGLERLSMGMSADFETAVKFGATSVRVGSALFGSRTD